LIKTASADEPRFDHRYQNGQVESLGLLIEEGSTNLVNTNQGDFNYSINNQIIATQLDIAPDGNSVLCKHDLTGSSGPFLNCRADTTLSAGQTYTMSMWLKGTTSFSASFAFVGETTGEIYANTANITTSWQRFTLTFTLVNTQTLSRLQVFFAQQGVDKVISIWGAQLENKSYATSYMPRVAGEQGSRGVDDAYIDGDNFSDWYNQTEGTVYCEFKCDSWNDANSASNYNRVYVVSSNDGFENDSFWIANNPLADNTLRYRIRYAGTNVFGPQDAVRNFDVVKSAFAVKTNNVALVTNGNIDASSTNVLLPSIMKSIHIGSEPAGGGIHYLNGHISQLTYYPTRLTNAQLQNLTK